MKNKILILIIGILIGAIITTSGFLIYNKLVIRNSKEQEKMQMDENREMKSPSNGNMREQPSKSNGGTPLEKPSNSKNSNV